MIFTYPYWYVTSAAQVADENDGYDISYLVRRGYQSRQARGNLESLLDRGYHRVYVART